MKKCIIFLIALSIWLGIKPELSAQKFEVRQSKNIDCPPYALIAARDDGEWKSGAYVQQSLLSAQLSTYSGSDHLVCNYYEPWSVGTQFSLYQKTPDGFPYCFTRADNRGFICRNWKFEPNEYIPLPFRGR